MGCSPMALILSSGNFGWFAKKYGDKDLCPVCIGYPMAVSLRMVYGGRVHETHWKRQSNQHKRGQYDEAED